jgi:hypothetical protein
LAGCDTGERLFESRKPPAQSLIYEADRTDSFTNSGDEFSIMNTWISGQIGTD